MKKETDLTTGISQPENVEKFMNSLIHPLYDTAKYLREMILSIDKTIGEGIFWNAPTFYFTGQMKQFDPKEYKRYIVGFNFYKKDTIRLIFLKGADATDPNALFEGDYKDGRRIISYKSIHEVKKSEIALRNIVKQLIQLMG